MKAIAVYPGKPTSVHLAEMPKPSIQEVTSGRGVLVQVLRVGVDGTDKEINAAEYGAAPDGYDFLVIGHESFGRVEEIGSNVTEFQPGDYVVATVRRPGSSIYVRIGNPDMTTGDTYFERGINLRHGYLAEYYAEDADFLVRIPAGLKQVAVLLKLFTVVQKGIAQAFEIQRRLRVPADKINLEFVLGNKVMVGTANAGREHFEAGVRDMAQAEAQYAGWLSRLLTHPVKGLDNYRTPLREPDHTQRSNQGVLLSCRTVRTS
jgi:NADPH:quinone reductase-like Zn-dependent oxidoreductase